MIPTNGSAEHSSWHIKIPKYSYTIILATDCRHSFRGFLGKLKSCRLSDHFF